ncbi:hypothetical protein ACFX1X_027436 [Malus domestica]
MFALLQDVALTNLIELQWDPKFDTLKVNPAGIAALKFSPLLLWSRLSKRPRTLQEISIAATVPQEDIGKYIKILGEALQLSQPINSNSISVRPIWTS